MYKVYILRPKKDWKPCYDKVFSIVVEAANEGEARNLASKNSGDEGRFVWMDTTKTTCEEVSITGNPRVICRDFASA